MKLFYKVTNGYDDRSIKDIQKSLSYFNEQLSSEQDAFKKAQCNLWIAYLNVLLTYEIPFSEADKKFLQHANFENTDELYEHMLKLKKYL